MICTRNLILGAGLAGLSAAASLPREETLVLERESQVGGLCRSYDRGCQRPPLTSRKAPVTYDASSLSNHAIAGATSSA